MCLFWLLKALEKLYKWQHKQASLGAYSDQFSSAYSTSLILILLPMQKTDEIEAANEAISVPFLQFVKRDTKGYLWQ